MAIFCLLHGDWHDGSCWEPLAGELGDRGHEAVAPDMPYGDPEAGFEQRIQPALQALEGVKGPAVVVAHGPAPPEVTTRRLPVVRQGQAPP
jgi:hypothetical protein